MLRSSLTRKRREIKMDKDGANGLNRSTELVEGRKSHTSRWDKPLVTKAARQTILWWSAENPMDTFPWRLYPLVIFPFQFKQLNLIIREIKREKKPLRLAFVHAHDRIISVFASGQSSAKQCHPVNYFVYTFFFFMLEMFWKFPVFLLLDFYMVKWTTNIKILLGKK